jgi:putative spermidine/putrescine transport system permease protein
MLLDYTQLGGLKWLLGGIVTLVCLFLLLPVMFIIILSFGSSQWMVFPPPGWTLRWYVQLFADPRWLESALTSLKLGLMVTVLSVLLGFMASYAVIRGRFPGRGFLRALFLTPMVMPVVVVAVALYSLYLRIGLDGTMTGFVLAHTVLAFPFAVIAISNSLERFDKAVEDAAILCGASAFEAVIRVTLPSIRLGLFSAALFSFLVSWDEVVVAIFMASPTLQTLPVRIWAALRQDLTPVIASASSVLVVLTVILMLIAAGLRKALSK